METVFHQEELLLGVQVEQVLVLLESLDQEMVNVQVVYNILQVVVEAVEIMAVNHQQVVEEVEVQEMDLELLQLLTLAVVEAVVMAAAAQLEAQAS
jgi:hypothetical protein